MYTNNFFIEKIMSYLLLRITDGWITNKNGDFYVEDTEQNCRMWIPNNLIGFTQNNEPYFKNQENNDIIQPIKIVEYEFRKSNVSIVENSNEELVQGSNVSSFVNNENSIQLEGNSVIVIENLHYAKEKNIWSVHETRALIGAIEVRYDDMHHVQKRKTFWSIIREELGSQNIKFSEFACKKNGLI